LKYPLFKVHVDVSAAMIGIESVLKSGFINEGAQVSEFKKSFQAYTQSKNVTLTNSCTSALTIALKIAGVDNDSEVITTSMTCVATNTPIKHLGGKIIWADIDLQTGNICPKSVEKKITKKTKAVICVNWAGLPCDLKLLQKICNKNNIKLIQDAAHSLGAEVDGKDICHFADMTCYSFQAIKHITCGDGGAIICKDDKDYKLAEKLKWFGLDRDETKDENGEWKGQRWEQDIITAGFKFNMNNLAAAIGISQIPHMKSLVDKHRKNAKLYSDLFLKNSEINSLKYPSASSPSFWVYTVLLDEKINRDKVIEALNSVGINAGLVHVPNHPYTCFKDSFVSLHGVDEFAKRQVSLPCGWWLSSEDVNFIAKTLLNLCKNEKQL
tara:strand:+ start:1623 stop:2768 length:1146 start_codon:yes stop_codon:yes gene_type:complete